MFLVPLWIVVLAFIAGVVIGVVYNVAIKKVADAQEAKFQARVNAAIAKKAPPAPPAQPTV